ncbi:MAG TPA: hypothetical protein VFR61_07010 [Nitrososphaeraceae archaeon]|jgi:hypothetical protein|nr:hypothetical protein [Nitrososphaeraceae archaeon]
MGNSELILEYVSKHEPTTESKVSRYMRDNSYCARETTRKLIFDNLIPNGKILDKKAGNSFHKLYINHKSKYNQIYKKLLDIEKFIKETNPRLYRVRDDRVTLEHSLWQEINQVAYEDDEKQDEIKHKERNFDMLRKDMRHLEEYYKNSITDILDVLYITIPRKNLGENDITSLQKKILELRSKVHYHRWKDDYDPSHFQSYTTNINKLEENLKKEKSIRDFMEEKKIEAKFTRPLKEIIGSFVKDFLT